MERRTSCLQSNVDFLQKTITKLAADQQQKLDAANRQIEGLKTHGGGAAKDRGRLAGSAEETGRRSEEQSGRGGGEGWCGGQGRREISRPQSSVG